MKWKALLRGADGYIPLFPSAFSRPELRVVRDADGKHYLLSTSLDLVDEPEPARTVALELVEVLNGLAELIWPSIYPKCTVVSLHGTASDGTIRNVICVVPRIGIVIGDDGTGVLDLLLDRSNQEFLGPIRPEVSGKIEDQLARNALRLLGREPDPNWSTLYKVLELVESAFGGREQLFSRGWGSRNEFERFRRSANSWLASGLDARHVQDWVPPADAMTIAEAREFVRALMARWLAT